MKGKESKCWNCKTLKQHKHDKPTEWHIKYLHISIRVILKRSVQTNGWHWMYLYEEKEKFNVFKYTTFGLTKHQSTIFHAIFRQWVSMFKELWIIEKHFAKIWQQSLSHSQNQIFKLLIFLQCNPLWREDSREIRTLNGVRIFVIK